MRRNKPCIQVSNSQLVPDPEPDPDAASLVPAELPLAPAFAFRGSGIFRILLNATNWTGLNFLKSLRYQPIPDRKKKYLQRDQGVIWVIVLYSDMCRWLYSWIGLSTKYARFQEVGNRCSKESDMRQGSRWDVHWERDVHRSFQHFTSQYICGVFSLDRFRLGTTATCAGCWRARWRGCGRCLSDRRWCW